jgi:isoamylase
MLPGQLYPSSVDGTYNPAAGLRFNPYNVLIDPCAKAIDGTIDWSDAIFAYRVGDEETDLRWAREIPAPPAEMRCN